jgi:hypothetical protein
MGRDDYSRASDGYRRGRAFRGLAVTIRLTAIRHAKFRIGDPTGSKQMRKAIKIKRVGQELSA